jgi:hypothetical protein
MGDTYSMTYLASLHGIRVRGLFYSDRLGAGWQLFYWPTAERGETEKSVTTHMPPPPGCAILAHFSRSRKN